MIRISGDNIKKRLLLISAMIIIVAFAFLGCSNNDTASKTEEAQMSNASYEQISQDEAKKIMDSEADCVIIDAREEYEYDEGHINGAIVIPYTEIEARAGDLIPDREQLILVYCRSGRRSKIAAQSLADMGYTNVKEFGGIIDWQYEIVK